MWWISYRGESGHGVDNIGVFEDDGSPRKKHPLLLDPSPTAHPLHIARGFALVGDDLYIANAWRKDSHIARYHRHGDTFRFQGGAREDRANCGDGASLRRGAWGRWSHLRLLPGYEHRGGAYRGDPQTRIRGRAPPQAISEREVSPRHARRIPRGSLPEYGDRTSLDVPAPLGLKVGLDKRGKPRHSVRGIVVHKKHLYVADEAGDAVKVFNVRSGELVAHITGREASWRRCTCSCTARRSISAPRAPAASWRSTWSPRNRRARSRPAS